MHESSSTKVSTIHMKSKRFQPRIPSRHKDKQAADSQLVSSKYSYYKTQKNKPSANRLVATG